MAEIVIVDSGSGNLRSVARAVEKVGGTPRVTDDPERIRQAGRILVPGQGAFSSCMSALRDRGDDEAIAEHIRRGNPYFGICLGLQVLFDHSEEHGSTPGLGILGGRVERLESQGGQLKVPHIGWNRARLDKPDDPMVAGLPDEPYFYFVHSYAVVPTDESVIALSCDYGSRFAAAVRKDNVFACQFHPEKSQQTGLRLLQNFVAHNLERAAC